MLSIPSSAQSEGDPTLPNWGILRNFIQVITAQTAHGPGHKTQLSQETTAQYIIKKNPVKFLHGEQRLKPGVTPGLSSVFSGSWMPWMWSCQLCLSSCACREWLDSAAAAECGALLLKTFESCFQWQETEKNKEQKPLWDKFCCK